MAPVPLRRGSEADALEQVCENLVNDGEGSNPKDPQQPAAAAGVSSGP